MSARRQKLLILDDDPDIVELLSKAFRELPYDAFFFGRGVDAVKAIFEAYEEGKPFDALIMDCALPHLDGFTIAKIVRLAETTGISKRAKIGYFTAFAQDVDKSTLLQEVGAEAYWHKPEDTPNLPELIQRWLDGPQLSRSLTNGGTV
jgi:two-component system sensor histidine kinase EvgS